MGLVFKKSTAQPSFTVAAAITGTTEATQTLTCAYTVAKARAANVTVRWYRHTADDGTDPTGVLLGTGTTYTLTGTDVGNYIRAIVTAINPAGTVSSTTAYTAIITAGDPPAPPALVTPAAITGTADVGETLTVTYSFTGQDSVAIQWYSYATEPTGSPLAGTDEVTLGTASTQALTESESGRWIVAVVTATNAVESTVSSDSVAMAGVDPYAPIAPAQYSVPAYDDSTLEKIYAYSGDDLQAKLNLLRPGKCLVIEAGATFTGNYSVDPAVTLLNSADNEWAYIITSDIAGLPVEGTRVTSSDVTHMPKLQAGLLASGASTNAVSGNGTLRILDGTHKLRIVGLEVTTQYTGTTHSVELHLMPIGRYGSGVGSNVIIDRCYIHGNTTGNNQDGIVLYSGMSSCAIIDSTIDYFKSITTESHAIHNVSCRGPLLIHNNAICAAGINIFMRDSDTTQTVHPEDITITKNYIHKRLEWDSSDASYAGVAYIIKNMVESKGSKRLLVQGNVFHHSWNKNQPGQVWFCQNYAEGISDLDFRDNLALDCGLGIQLANPFDNNRGYGWERMRFYNNLYAYPRPSLSQIQIGDVGSGFGRYLTIKNNTWVFYGGRSSGALMYFNSAVNPSGIEHMIVEDNIFRQSPSSTGVGANGGARGRAAAAIHVTDFDFNKNVSVGESLADYSTTYDDWRNWKSGNTGGIWNNAAVGYVNTAFTELGHFALSGSSQFKNNGTDGQDIGADVTAIAAQINASDNPFGA